jgi:hypothetical protein
MRVDILIRDLPIPIRARQSSADVVLKGFVTHPSDSLSM